ncbi:Hint domain-containing protein [Paracoccus sp. CPCC 101403]|uniref:Hint domain-containing protein n=1 Tax=Paracoccus broussonetiae TaxID=3075834 RepID=A0ABU3EDC8_9RHOB|nr:Hint domain-containing protein [Paracoccus sp. CPCC 101403]MDT1062223.1 Hint domain-containing protein [Paracoccus sp. CPCC 101403]
MPTVTLTIRGDQLLGFTSVRWSGNGQETQLTAFDVAPVGGADEIYTVTVTQVSDGEEHFANGQFVTITDDSGAVLLQQAVPRHDVFNNLASGDEYTFLFPGGFEISLNIPDVTHAYNGFILDLNSSANIQSGPPTFIEYTFPESDIGNAAIGDNDGRLDFADVSPRFPCFAEGTLVDTPDGQRAVETLRVGDLISTATGATAIRWIGQRLIEFLGRDDPRRPIVIAAGALGPGLPTRDLVLSRQHRIVIDLGEGPLLAPAKSLLALPGVRNVRGVARLRYVTLLTASHAIIRAEGLAAETFWPGRWMLEQLPARDRNVVLSVSGGFADDPAQPYGDPALPFRTVQFVKRAIASGRLPVVPQPRCDIPERMLENTHPLHHE